LKSLIIKSADDASVNFTLPLISEDVQTSSELPITSDTFLESRYVERDKDSFIIYLSSHFGCDQACRMCHLTQTKQTTSINATFHHYKTQVDSVMNYYDTEIKTSKKGVSYSFMARGEALNNPLLFDNQNLFKMFKEEAQSRNLTHKIKLSTIMPESLMKVNLEDHINDDAVVMYYSLYSVNPSFRKRWLPKALNPNIALAKLTKFHKTKGNAIVLHFAFIKGQNDSIQDMKDIESLLSKYDLDYKVNIVRYNPHHSQSYVESPIDTIKQNMEIISNFKGCKAIQMISRVGLDVHASCGMFLSKEDIS